ncbi:hypothetical protein KY310_00525 [Candidatus Woesearchaeota archaeon]|nr:hypothetical protein [Candidatus Woesearchaeota archaeon]
MVGDSYWYCDYIGLERISDNTRHILGIRYWSREETKRHTIFLKRKIPIPSKFIHRNSRGQFEQVFRDRERDRELSSLELTCFISSKDTHRITELERKHPLTRFGIEDGSFNVFQIRVPPNKSTLDKLIGTRSNKKRKKGEPPAPKGPWQKGGYEVQVRMELYPEWMQRKVDLNGLEKVLEQKERLEFSQRVLEDDIKDFVGGDDEDKAVRGNITRITNAVYDYINNKEEKGLSSFFLYLAKRVLKPESLRIDPLTQKKYPEEETAKFVDQLVNESEQDEKKRKRLCKYLLKYIEDGTETGLKKFFEQKGRQLMEQKAEAIRKGTSDISDALKELDPANELTFNPDSLEYEITLNCFDEGRRNQVKGFNWRTRLPTEDEIRWGIAKEGQQIEDKLTPEEFLQQVICYLDIEKTFYKTDDEEELLELRKELHEDWVKAGKLKKPATRDAKQRAIAAQKREVEEKLTVLVDGEQVRLWDPDYQDRITDYTLIYTMPDGTEIKECHSLRQFSDKERQAKIEKEGLKGFKVMFHNSRKKLMDKVVQDMKERNVVFILAHNLGYDIPETIREAKEVKSEALELFVSNILPKIDTAKGEKGSKKKIFVRMKKLVEFLDTFRMAKGMAPFLQSSMPKGTHKLADVADFYEYEPEEFPNAEAEKEDGAAHAESDAEAEEAKRHFKKTHDAQELRADAIRHLRGDEEAAWRLLNYALDDVPPLQTILKNGDFMRLVTKLQRQLLPFCSLTEIAFSPNIIKKIYDFEHWERNHNKRSELRGQRIAQEHARDFERLYIPMKHNLIRDAGIDYERVTPGEYKNVWQCYMPQEWWVNMPQEWGEKEAVFRKYPQWRKFFDDLPNEQPLHQVALLRYARVFFKQYLQDHFEYNRELTNFENNMKRMNASNLAEAEEMMQHYWAAIDQDYVRQYGITPRTAPGSLESLAKKYDHTFERLVNLLIRCKASLGNLVPRVPRAKPKEHGQQGMLFGDEIEQSYFELNHPQMALLRQRQGIIRQRLQQGQEKKNKGQEKLLDSYIKCYDKLMEITEERAELIKKYRKEWESEQEDLPKHFKIRPDNAVYTAQQYRRLLSMERRFFAKYGLPPEQISPTGEKHTRKSLTSLLKEAYQNLAEELKEYNIIELRGDYLFLDRKPKEGSMLVPIRKIDSFVHQEKYSQEEDSVDAQVFFDWGESEAA